MPKLDVINTDKKVVGSIDLSDAVFGVQINYPLIHQVIKAQLAGRRQGNAKTKVKSEVRGGGKKPFKQKGTGNARQGSSRSPLMPGGGQNFGPQPRSYAQRTPKEMIRGALRSALSERLKSKRLMIIDQFKLDEPKTKAAVGVFSKKLQVDRALVVDLLNESLERASRNIPGLRILRAEAINVYDIIKYPWLLITKAAASEIENRLNGLGTRVSTSHSETTEAPASRPAKKPSAKKAVAAKSSTKKASAK